MQVDTTQFAIMAASALAILFLRERYSQWHSARTAKKNKDAELQHLQADSLAALAKSVLALDSKMAAFEQLAAMPKYLEGLVKVCEAQVKQHALLQQSIDRFTVLVAGDSRETKRVLQMPSETDAWRATETMVKMAEGLSLEDAAAMVDEEEKKMAASGYQASAM